MKCAYSYLFLFLSLSLIATESLQAAAVESGAVRSDLQQPGTRTATEVVKIPLTLTAFEKVVYKKKEGEQVRFIPHAPVKLLLNSRIQKSQHFYVRGWHLETRPVSFQKESQVYTVEVSIGKLHGQDNQLENYLGSVKLRGQLQPQPGKQTLVLGGTQEQILKDQWNNPTLKIALGHAPKSKTPSGHPTVSRK